MSGSFRETVSMEKGSIFSINKRQSVDGGRMANFSKVTTARA